MTLLLLVLAACTGATDSVDETCELPDLVTLHPSGGELANVPVAPACVQTRHDALIVLGCPANDDGTPSSCQRQRVGYALALSAAGYGDTFVTTGGAVYNDHVEAEVLRDALVAGGIPDDHVLLEPNAEHTDQNLAYSGVILRDHGWETALVVSDPFHLGFAAVCDADCCVRDGRLTLLRFPVDGDEVMAGHYVLGPPPTDAECAHLVGDTTMCANLPDRTACAADARR